MFAKEEKIELINWEKGIRITNIYSHKSMGKIKEHLKIKTSKGVLELKKKLNSYLKEKRAKRKARKEAFTEGQALCSSAHPYSNGSSSVQDNAGTTALSATPVETARQAMAKYCTKEAKNVRTSKRKQNNRTRKK